MYNYFVSFKKYTKMYFFFCSGLFFTCVPRLLQLSSSFRVLLLKKSVKCDKIEMLITLHVALKQM